MVPGKKVPHSFDLFFRPSLCRGTEALSDRAEERATLCPWGQISWCRSMSKRLRRLRALRSSLQRSRKTISALALDDGRYQIAVCFKILSFYAKDGNDPDSISLLFSRSEGMQEKTEGGGSGSKLYEKFVGWSLHVLTLYYWGFCFPRLKRADGKVLYRSLCPFVAPLVLVYNLLFLKFVWLSKK